MHPGEEIGPRGPMKADWPIAVFVREAARGGRLFPIPDDMPLTVDPSPGRTCRGGHARGGTGGRSASTTRSRSWVADRVDMVSQRWREPGRPWPRRTSSQSTCLTPGADWPWKSARQSPSIPPRRKSGARLERIHGTAPLMFGHSAATSGFIEASGATKVLTDIVDRAGAGAHISVVALHYNPVPVNFLNVLMKELVIRGSIDYPARFSDAIELLQRRDLSALITDRFRLSGDRQGARGAGGQQGVRQGHDRDAVGLMMLNLNEISDRLEIQQLLAEVLHRDQRRKIRRPPRVVHRRRVCGPCPPREGPTALIVK